MYLITFKKLEHLTAHLNNNKIYAFPRHCLPWYHENSHTVEPLTNDHPHVRPPAFYDRFFIVYAV